jgi:hypothetical protein
MVMERGHYLFDQKSKKKKRFPPFISVEKNGSNFVSTISTYDRQKWN